MLRGRARVEMEKIRAIAVVALPVHSTERAVEAMLQLTMNRKNWVALFVLMISGIIESMTGKNQA